MVHACTIWSVEMRMDARVSRLVGYPTRYESVHVMHFRALLPLKSLNRSLYPVLKSIVLSAYD